MMVLMGKMVILIGNVVIFMDSYGDLMIFNEFVSWFNGDVWMDFNFNGDLMDFNDFQWLSMIINGDFTDTIRIEPWTSRTIEYEEITNGRHWKVEVPYTHGDSMVINNEKHHHLVGK